jgi:azurin
MKRVYGWVLIAAVAFAPAALFAQGTAKPAPPAQAAAAKGRLIEISAGDDMKFSVVEIAAKPGELLTVRLKSTGTLPKIAMGHNFVLLKGEVSAVDFANDPAAAASRATDFIPPARKGDVLAMTTMIGPGETAEVTFSAPKAPGAYNYLCSFVGHFAAGMRGRLTVK